MPMMQMYSPEDPPPAGDAPSCDLLAWSDRTLGAQRSAYADLVTAVALAGLYVEGTRCCDDPACPVTTALSDAIRRTWRLFPPSVLERAFGAAGAATLTAD